VVDDAAKLLRQLVGTDPQFRTDEVGEFLRQNIVGQLAPALANARIPVLDLAANQEKIAAGLAGTLTAALADLGIRIPRFVIENISLPPDVEAMLDKRTSMGVVGDLDDYTRFQAANALEDAASNPSGGNSGMGIGVGVALGQQVGAALGPHADPPPAGPPPAGPPPLPGAAMYIAVNGQQVGPLQPGELPARVRSGELTRDTLVWHEGMPAWAAAATVAELAAVLRAVPPPLPTPPASTPPPQQPPV
jgi:SPFH domain-Band 7 family/GYF domain 2